MLKMEEENSNLEKMLKHAEEYIKTRQELTQHIVTEKVLVISTSLASGLLLIFLFIVALLILSAAVAILLSELMNKRYIGFFIVGGFYLLLAVVLSIMKDKWLNRPMMNKIIRKIYKED
jgi:hypothetical protein